MDPVRALTYDGEPITSLAARVGVRELIFRDRLESTLDLIHELAAVGAAPGLAVLADEQTRGRGRQGRSWYSPPGAGIWLGYLVRPESPLTAGVFALRAGLATAEALADLGITVRLKWPNDVLLGGRKVAGILCEARSGPRDRGWIGVGIGMNVYGTLPDELRATATSLEEHAEGVSRIAVLERLLPRLGQLSLEPVLAPEEQAAFDGLDALRGVRLAEPVAGVGNGIDRDGSLRVDTGAGIERVLSGTVRLV